MFYSFINVSMLFILLTFQCTILIYTYKNNVIMFKIRHVIALLFTILDSIDFVSNNA